MRRLILPLLLVCGSVLAQTAEPSPPDSGKPAIEQPKFPVPATRDSTDLVPLFRPRVIIHREIMIPKDPFLGGTLSLVLPGAGQAYCGKWFKGVAFLVGSYLSYGLSNGIRENEDLKPEARDAAAGAFLILGLVVHGWSVIDGVNSANSHNRRLLESP